MIKVYHIRTRKAAHTGEHVLVEPLPRFLRRDIAVRDDSAVSQQVPRSPTLDEYDRGLR